MMSLEKIHRTMEGHVVVKAIRKSKWLFLVLAIAFLLVCFFLNHTSKEEIESSGESADESFDVFELDGFWRCESSVMIFRRGEAGFGRTITLGFNEDQVELFEEEWQITEFKAFRGKGLPPISDYYDYIEAVKRMPSDETISSKVYKYTDSNKYFYLLKDANEVVKVIEVNDEYEEVFHKIEVKAL